MSDSNYIRVKLLHSGNKAAAMVLPQPEAAMWAAHVESSFPSLVQVGSPMLDPSRGPDTVLITATDVMCKALVADAVATILTIERLKKWAPFDRSMFETVREGLASSEGSLCSMSAADALHDSMDMESVWMPWLISRVAGETKPLFGTTSRDFIESCEVPMPAEVINHARECLLLLRKHGFRFDLPNKTKAERDYWTDQAHAAIEKAGLDLVVFCRFINSCGISLGSGYMEEFGNRGIMRGQMAGRQERLRRVMHGRILPKK